MNGKRKKHTEEMKARVALEAVKGQWKRQLVRGSPEVFRRGSGARNGEELTGPLYEEIGRLKMEIDWLKKKL